MARAQGPMRRHWSASPKKRQLKSRLKVRQNPCKTMSIVLGNPMLLNQRNDIRRGRILAHAELITKEQVLDFEPARRLEEADGEHCERMQEREHRARSCADSTRRCESQAGSDFGNDSKTRIARRNRAKSSRSRALELDAPLSAFLCVRSWFSLEKPYEKPRLFGLQSLQVSHHL